MKNNQNNKIFSIGLGKLGLIFSYILCDSGYKVYGYDKNLNIKKNIYNKKKNNLEPKLNGKSLKFKKKYIINVTSTVNPGSCHLFINFLEKKYSLKHGKEFVITYNPHLIALGQIYKDVLNAETVIIGSDIEYGHKFLKKFYSNIYNNDIKKLKFLKLEEAEISKISINAFITLKISFSDTLSQIAINTPFRLYDKRCFKNY